jgi:hypothetical protein
MMRLRYTQTRILADVDDIFNTVSTLASLHIPYTVYDCEDVTNIMTGLHKFWLILILIKVVVSSIAADIVTKA